MRQTALLTILAQIGAKVPAQEFELTPVDRYKLLFSTLAVSTMYDFHNSTDTLKF